MSSEYPRPGWKWLTPSSLPVDKSVLRGVCLPADSEILTLFGGALYLMADADNWEDSGGASPQATADYFAALVEEFEAGEVSSCGGGNMPVGSIIQMFAVVPPAGWLLCNGQQYLRVDYPDLYAVTPANHIIDADNFIVPNMSGRFSRGAAWPSFGDGVQLNVFYATGGAPNVWHFFCNYYIKAVAD